MLLGQITEDVDVIVVTVNQHIMTAFIPQNSGHVREEFRTDFFSQPRPALLGRKNDMSKQNVNGLRHIYFV